MLLLAHCLFLKNYQVTTGYSDPQTGRQTLYAQPRSWSYLATIQIPQGQIVTEVATAVCPTVSVQGIGNGGIDGNGNVITDGVAVVLTNTGSEAATTQIIQGQTGGVCDGSAGCCQPDGSGGYTGITTVVQVPPFSTYTATIGTCNNMALDIQVQNLVNGVLTWGDCTTLAADFVSSSVNLISNLPSQVQTAVAIVQSDNAESSVALYTAMMKILLATTPSAFNNSLVMSTINSQIAAVNGLAMNPLNFSGMLASATFNNTDFNNAMDYIAEQAAAAGNANQQIIDLNQQNIDISATYPKLLKNMSDTLVKADDAQATLDRLIAAFNNIPGGLDGFANFIAGLADDVANALAKLANGFTLPGLPSLGLPSLSTIVEVLLIVVGVYIFIKVGLPLLKSSRGGGGAGYKLVQSGSEPNLHTPRSRTMNEWQHHARQLRRDFLNHRSRNGIN